ncbi:MAG: CHASE domain-containing protein [Magnetococcales bacterium]|nr:CHASE domain-containing protein [Magnetococcales bacterium]
MHTTGNCSTRLGLFLIWLGWLFWPGMIHDAWSGDDEQREITAVILRDFSPLYQLDAAGQPAGFAIDVLNEVARNARWSLRYLVVDNWQQLTDALRDRRADLSPATAVTQAWEQEFLFSETVARDYVACFVLRDNQTVHGCDNLANRTITTVRSGASHQRLEKEHDIQLLATQSIDASLNQLLQQQAEVLVAPERAVWHKAEGLGVSGQIKAVGRPLLELKRAMMVRRDLAHLLPVINKVLRDYIESPHYRSSYQQYYGQPSYHYRGSVAPWPIDHLTGWLVILVVMASLVVVGWRYDWLLGARYSAFGYWTRFFNTQKMAWLVLVGTSSLTVAGWHLTTLYVEDRSSDRFAYKVEEARTAIVKRMQEYEQVLRGGVAFLNADGSVTRDDWRTYVDTLQIDTFWPGVQGIGFSLMIAPEELDQHIALVRSQGFEHYTVRPEGVRSLYSSIIYLEPFRDRNLRAFGYDMYSEPIRRAAMERACDTGQPAVSGKVILVQETDKAIQPGLLMYLPVYRTQQLPTTIAERRQALMGFVYSPFRIRDLMRGILGLGVPDLELEIYDGDQISPEALLYTTIDLSSRINQVATPRYSAQRRIELPGRNWTVLFKSRASFEEEVHSSQPAIIAVLGVIADILLFVVIQIISGQKARITREVERIGRDLAIAETRYQGMVEGLQDVIFQTDHLGRWTFLNQSWQQVTGFSVSESLGQHFIHYVYPDDHAAVMDHFYKLAEGEQSSFCYETRGVSRSGFLIWIEVHASALLDGQGVFDGSSGILRDITIIKQAHASLNQAREVAEAANRAKSQFLANMSHELRTPLNSLLILSKLLTNDSNLTPEQIESAQVIHESGTHLLRLINEVLDLSKVEAGRMDVVSEWRDFRDFLDSLQRQFQPIANSRGLQWQLKLGPDLPSGMHTDWVKVEQILRNLLSNAFKFTQRGAVVMHVARVDQANAMAFTVTDSGIGIAEDKQELIFETFQQLDGTTSRHYGGTGLGLSIARSFAHLLGGSIQLQSQPGVGSSFTLLVPIDPQRVGGATTLASELSTTVMEQATPVGVNHASGNKPQATLLVVDDDDFNLFAISRMLQDRVHQVITAVDGVDALHQLEQHPAINVVLMDIMMPNMDGYQAMREIRRQDRWADLPLIALTAKSMPGDQERCLEAGASAYLSKPLQIEQLLLLLNQWVSLTDVRASSSPTVEQTLVTQGRPITVLLVDDDVRSNFALAKMLQHQVEKILMASDGVKALKQLEQHPEINLVLMDLLMPNLDGRQTIQAIRQNPRHQGLVIVAMTANSSMTDEQQCLSAGADAYLTKPLTMERLWPVMRPMVH